MPVFEWAGAIYERLEEGGGGSLGDRNQARRKIGVGGEEGAGRMRNEGDVKQTSGGDDSVAPILFASPKDLTRPASSEPGP